MEYDLTNYVKNENIFSYCAIERISSMENNLVEYLYLKFQINETNS